MLDAQALEICLAKCGHMAWPDRRGYLKREELQGVYAHWRIPAKSANVGKASIEYPSNIHTPYNCRDNPERTFL